jgi:hypothetical protein
MDPNVARAAERAEITAGDAFNAPGTADASSANVWLYAGIGIFLLVVVGVAFFVMLR